MKISGVTGCYVHVLNTPSVCHKKKNEQMKDLILQLSEGMANLLPSREMMVMWNFKVCCILAITDKQKSGKLKKNERWNTTYSHLDCIKILKCKSILIILFECSLEIINDLKTIILSCIQQLCTNKQDGHGRSQSAYVDRLQSGASVVDIKERS